MARTVVGLVGLWAVAAVAGPIKVAVVPAAVQGPGLEGDAIEETRRDLLAEVVKQQVQLVSTAQLRDVLEGREDCAGKPSCLGAVATEVSSEWALWASITAERDQFVATARVVSAAGVVVRSVPAIALAKQMASPRAEQIHALLEELVRQLHLDTLGTPSPVSELKPSPTAEVMPSRVAETPSPLQPVVSAPVEAVRPPVSEPPAVVAQAAPVETEGPASGFTLRQGAYVVGGVAVLAGAVAAGLGISVLNDRQALINSSTPTAEGTRILNTNADATRAAGLDTKQSIGAGLAIGAGVAAGAAVLMFALSTSDAPAVTAWATPGGAGLGWSTRWP